MGGAVGLDGKVVMDYINFHTSSSKKRKRLFDQIILISKGALKAMSDKRDDAKETKP